MRDVTYIRTDENLPPVAIIDRSPITVRHRVIFGIVAVIGAVAWAIIAFARGEAVNAVWLVSPRSAPTSSGSGSTPG